MTAEPTPAPTPAPVAEAAPTKQVEDVARAALDRSNKKKSSSKSGDTQEFWETWAAEKTTREPAKAAPAPAAAPAAEATESEAAGDDGDEPKRGRGGRDRDRGRGKRDDKAKAADKKSEAKADAKDSKKSDKSDKSDKKAAPASAPATGTDAKLFISLGKKHGVSADDLRALLAGPVGGDKSRIGSVMLRDAHAHVKVSDGDVDKIIAALHGTQHNKHEVTVERARA